MLLEISKSILCSILFMPIAKVVGLYASSLKRNELKDRSSQNIYRTGGLLIFFGTIISWITISEFIFNYYYFIFFYIYSWFY